METDMADSIGIERQAAAWLARRDAGDWTAADQAGLDAWLAESTARRVAWVRLEAAWRESGRLKALGAGLPAGAVPLRGQWTRSALAGLHADGAVGTDAAPGSRATGAATASPPGPLDAATLVFAPRPRRSTYPLRGLVAVAATAVLAMSLVLGWRHYAPTTPPVAYRTAVGALESMPLADGTEATLSSDSRIVVAFSRRERHVDLERGEAFFHAATNPRRPFVVAAAGHRVVAVGTRFAVRRDGDGVRVVVTEGLVRLESAPGPDGRRQPTTLLPAGSVALAGDDGVVVQSGTVEQAERMLSWRDGFLAFHDTPLAVAAAEFNRYNARKIVIGDPSVASMRIGGSFRWSNTEAFVRLLERGFPVRAERRVDAIVLHGQ